ncbi:hypothetical protein B296_00021992 [Ensete ventricosum]|uniref:Uncharacterized protein n=1 Tax=Ensete ventricosum TaxID=4639 RepID=A0A426YJ15_ENSVE|nr:hypothetical protein B296_00021992 [Ensete ventricosum]
MGGGRPPVGTVALGQAPYRATAYRGDHPRIGRLQWPHPRRGDRLRAGVVACSSCATALAVNYVGATTIRKNRAKVKNPIRAARRGEATYKQAPYRGGPHGHATYKGSQSPCKGDCIRQGLLARAVARNQGCRLQGQHLQEQPPAGAALASTAPVDRSLVGTTPVGRPPAGTTLARGQWRLPAGRGHSDGGPLDVGKKG